MTSRGFTLVELLVVLVILGLLAGLVGPQVVKHVGASKSRTAYLQIEELGMALETYRLDMDVYPPAERGLAALVQKPPGAEKWNGPYLRKPFVPKDPWGREYRYRYPGSTDHSTLQPRLRDADGGEGENADVQNWK